MQQGVSFAAAPYLVNLIKEEIVNIHLTDDVVKWKQAFVEREVELSMTPVNDRRFAFLSSFPFPYKEGDLIFGPDYLHVKSLESITNIWVSGTKRIIIHGIHRLAYGYNHVLEYLRYRSQTCQIIGVSEFPFFKHPEVMHPLLSIILKDNLPPFWSFVNMFCETSKDGKGKHIGCIKGENEILYNYIIAPYTMETFQEISQHIEIKCRMSATHWALLEGIADEQIREKMINFPDQYGYADYQPKLTTILSLVEEMISCGKTVAIHSGDRRYLQFLYRMFYDYKICFLREVVKVCPFLQVKPQFERIFEGVNLVLKQHETCGNEMDVNVYIDNPLVYGVKYEEDAVNYVIGIKEED